MALDYKMSDKKTILIISSWYPSLGNPTYGSFVKEQALLLRSFGHNVIVLDANLNGTFMQSLSKRKTVLSESMDEGIRLFRVRTSPIFPKSRSWSYSRLAKKCLSYLKDQMDIKDIDLIHAHSTFLGGYIANYIYKKEGTPYVLTEHASALIFKPETFTRSDIKHFKTVCHQASSLIFVSTFQQEQLIKRYNIETENAHVIPNLVDHRFFTHTKPNSNDGSLSFITIGSCIAVKQLDLLIQAWKIVNEQFPQLKLTIAGDGPLKNELIELMNGLHLMDSVQWMNKLSRDSVLEQICAHDALISSSKLETFGLTVAEAIACGKPVVVTDSGGVKDIVRSENGIVTGQTAHELAEGIVSLYLNYSAFDNEQISKKAKEQFGSEAVYNRLMQVYTAVKT